MKQGHDYKKMLLELQRITFDYFLNYSNPDKGLIADNSRADSPCSITAVGLALASYPVAVERGYLSRSEAVELIYNTLNFFWNSRQGTNPDATGYKGFYYHFLDMESGRRTINSEISTIDTTFLLAGMLAAALYFDGDKDREADIRQLADALFRRADWEWALHGGPTVSHGWRPESGFLKGRWQGYSEALLLYALGLGSPTHPLPTDSYDAWTWTYEWREKYGIEHLYAGPLFIHQLSHVWIDFRGIQDDYMRGKCLDYFDNSRRATYMQQAYAKRNPQNYEGYGELAWGITASDGPGEMTKVIDGTKRRFYGYMARGVPEPDDGTLSPWASIASLPFAPELVLPTIDFFNENHPEMISKYGFKCSFNPTFPADGETGWISEGYYGLDQGPIVLMIENYFSGLLWRLMRRCPYLADGLRRARFRGGWLQEKE